MLHNGLSCKLRANTFYSTCPVTLAAGHTLPSEGDAPPASPKLADAIEEVERGGLGCSASVDCWDEMLNQRSRKLPFARACELGMSRRAGHAA